METMKYKRRKWSIMSFIMTIVFIASFILLLAFATKLQTGLRRVLDCLLVILVVGFVVIIINKVKGYCKDKLK